jgi:hypothetical protein
MEDIFLSTVIGDRRMICMSPLSQHTYRSCGGVGLGGDYGYFIYEIDAHQPQAGIEVIAKAKSTDAALRLYAMITGHQG